MWRFLANDGLPQLVSRTSFCEIYNEQVVHALCRMVRLGLRPSACLYLGVPRNGRMGVTGPVFNYSDTWQLVINTGTTVATFLMIFVLQHSQNRDSTAIQAKLDELIRASNASNKLIRAEKLTEEEVEELRFDPSPALPDEGASPRSGALTQPRKDALTVWREA